MHDPQHPRPPMRPPLRHWLAVARAGVQRTILLLALSVGSLSLDGTALSAGTAPTDEGYFTAARERLVKEIEGDVALTSGALGTDHLDPAVMHALRTVPREEFVPPRLRAQAYLNSPLPIGEGQTISQPYIVAVMSQLAGVQAGDRVYELGTGSGYQAAVLAAMGVAVYSVEIVPELAERAAATLKRLGYDSVHVRAGDGYLGWPEAAPFDAVLVTAAHPEIPRPLVEQLRVGGRLVMPVGGVYETQQLTVFTKQPDGTLQRRRVLPVRFVPVTGAGARGKAPPGGAIPEDVTR